ncbi:adenosylcobinamide-phosphate synthase CbiB [Metabacillus malikii]|uniref:Cobalamin biosynthesis protein CobD n=1 Tax=Metabacillus malikii TaxID=1504265 RepID=A0ABT9Z9S2_9BACI|nr:adenosylcobinamide-phosphate synthase CbiB [Metabacillus malikii]MDQ0228992.1 adenosylcobinamide-phosphate synthase [Metabacillus malikii]
MIWTSELLQLSATTFCLIIIAAIFLDLLIGDPIWLPHPVIQIGKLIKYLDRRWNRGNCRVLKGIGLTVTVVVSVFVLTCIVIVVAFMLHPLLAVLLQIYLISTTIAVKGLASAGKNVLKPLEAGNLIEARKQLSMVVGRDTDSLPESEIVRGAVETVAENTVDGITAPLFWAFIGGAPLAMAYRAINTLDSMVGYKNDKYEKFGWASARLDDIANWIPARLTAACMFVASLFIKGSKKQNGWKIVHRDARKHPSPNSGWSEALVAGLLGVQLGGLNYYQGLKSERATMGDRTRPLNRNDIRKTITYMHGGWIVFTAVGMLIMFTMGK